MLLQLVLSSLVFLNALAAQSRYPNNLEDLLSDAEYVRKDFCASCLLWARRPDSAKKNAVLRINIKSNLGPAEQLEACGTRVKSWIVQDFVHIVDKDESEFPGISAIRPAFLDEIQKSDCSEDDYDENYGERDGYDTDWEEEARLFPERHPVIDVIEKGRGEEDGEPPSQESSSFVDGRDQSLVTNVLSRLGVGAAFGWGAMAGAGRSLQGAESQIL